MKFIHAADLHIDSPFKGLESYPGAPIEILREATRKATENLISLAIKEQIDFVIIAGDLFDGEWRDMNTGLWAAEQFRRLEKENIPIFSIKGNHDAASQVTKSIRWPDNFSENEFPVDAPATKELPDLKVAIHGQGFASRAEKNNLAKSYPAKVEGFWNIGVLHTSLQGSDQHDTYAPAKLSDLIEKEYDYWALGHIHLRELVDAENNIVYSGNIQGRHIRETGPKGCYLVEQREGKLIPQFHELDVVRWERLDIQLHPEDDMDDLYIKTRASILDALSKCDSQHHLAVRIYYQGSTIVHSDLKDLEEVTSEVRNIANEFESRVWIEKIKDLTTPSIEIDSLRDGNDLLGELLRIISYYVEGDSLPEFLEQEVKDVWGKVRSELKNSDTNISDSSQCKEWMQQAERLIVSYLSEETE